MATVDIINKHEIPIPKYLSTRLFDIYDDYPPLMFQGSPKTFCNELMLAVKKCDREADWEYFLQNNNRNRQKYSRLK